jgi:hypothetical protein
VTRRGLRAVVLAIAIGLASAAAPWASSSPDGLERVAGDAGFGHRARTHAAPAAHYAVPGIADPRLATGLAGVGGTLAVFVVGSGAARVLRRRAEARGRAPTLPAAVDRR